MPWIVDAGDASEAVDQAGHELALVGDDRGHPGDELAAALARVGRPGGARDVAVCPTDVAQVVGRGERAGDRLERLGPGLEPVVRRAGP